MSYANLQHKKTLGLEPVWRGILGWNLNNGANSIYTYSLSLGFKPRRHNRGANSKKPTEFRQGLDALFIQ